MIVVRQNDVDSFLFLKLQLSTNESQISLEMLLMPIFKNRKHNDAFGAVDVLKCKDQFWSCNCVVKET